MYDVVKEFTGCAVNVRLICADNGIGRSNSASVLDLRLLTGLPRFGW